MILTRQLGDRPPYPKNAAWYENFLAKTVHFLLYASLLLMPITAIFMTLFNGKPLAFFSIPLSALSFIHSNKPLAEVFYQGHVYTSYLLLALVGLHLVALVYHHFYLKDKVLNRMWIK